MIIYPFYIGSLSLILGVSFLIYKIGKNDSFKMKDHGVGVGTLSLILGASLLC